MWPVKKSKGEWRLTADYCGLNEVTKSHHFGAAVPNMLELQYKLHSKAATTDITSVISVLQFLWQQSADYSLLSLDGASSTAGIDCPRVEAQPNYFPWTDPHFPSTGEQLILLYITYITYEQL